MNQPVGSDQSDARRADERCTKGAGATRLGRLRNGTGNERLVVNERGAAGYHRHTLLYVCVNAASVVRLLYTRREQPEPEESVSQSVSRSRRVAHGCTPRSRIAVLSFFFFYFLVFHFMRCFNLVIEKLDRENLFRSLTDRDYRASVAECATPGVILEISDTG